MLMAVGKLTSKTDMRRKAVMHVFVCESSSRVELCRIRRLPDWAIKPQGSRWHYLRMIWLTTWRKEAPVRPGGSWPEPKEFISKGRLDALTDGVFAFAMTLPVVKFDLPEDFQPRPHSPASPVLSAAASAGPLWAPSGIVTDVLPSGSVIVRWPPVAASSHPTGSA